MHTGKVAIIESYLTSQSVHFSHVCIDETSLTALQGFTKSFSFKRFSFPLQNKSSQFSYQESSIVATREHHPIQQVFHTVLSLVLDIRCSPLDSTSCLCCPDFDAFSLDFLLFEKFQNCNQIHDLGQTGKLPYFLGSLRIEGLSLPHFIQDPALRSDIGGQIRKDSLFHRDCFPRFLAGK